MTRPKALRRRLIASAPARGAVRLLARATPRGAGDLLVVMFHQTLDAARFGAQLDALLESSTPVQGADVIAALHGGPPLPARPLWLTFDDAYRSFGEVAWPVLEARGLGATLFVPTGFIGTGEPFWWERLAAAFGAPSSPERLASSRVELDGLALGDDRARRRAVRRARDLVKALPHEEGMALVEELVDVLGEGTPGLEARVHDWNELRALAARGVELGGHTRRHPMLDRVPLDVARSEIRGGLEDLAREVGTPLSALAYPSGQFTPEVAVAAREEGLACAVTTEPGYERLDAADPWRLRRVAIGPHADAVTVRLRLSLAHPGVRRLAGHGRGGPRAAGA